jgi:hypothetical protein
VTNTSKETAEVREGLREWVSRVPVKRVAARLECSTSYIYQIIREDNPMTPGGPFIKRYRKATKPRKPPKPRIVITFDSPEVAEFAKGLSMAERRAIITEEKNERNC